MTNLQIWQWTLSSESAAPCFVRDVLAMRQSTGKDADFFWLGHTPCRTVILVGMVVAIQVYDKRAIYTIDDGTAVIDCILRHPNNAVPAPVPRSPARHSGGPGTKTIPKHSPAKKPRLNGAKSKSAEPPPPITESGYPVRVVGKVVRHFQSKQIHADTIDPCPSSLDEIAHLERVIGLHKTKYSLAVTFVPPPKLTSRAAPPDASPQHVNVDGEANANASIFSDPLHTSRTGPSTAPYALPIPPRVPILLRNRNQPPNISTHPHSTYHEHTHFPSSPTASSIVSSTPSSPCKPSSPVKARKVSRKPTLRHPSRVHTRDLTANTFRLYVKHYMDNAPPPFPASCSSPSRSACRGIRTPTKHAQDDTEGNELTPRPHPSARSETREGEEDGDEDGLNLGFTLSHLRRVPELALLAVRVVRAETRKRDKADRERQRATTSVSSGKRDSRGNGFQAMPTPRTRPGTRTGTTADPPRKKVARLFSWAVVKLYEEGNIVLWDGDVRPLPIPPPPPLSSGLCNNSAQSGILEAPSTLADLSTSSTSALVLYNSSASASLYSHYHALRRPTADKHQHQHDEDSECDVDVDADADPAYLSDPPVDEEAYIPLTPRFLARYVREVVAALRRGGGRGGAGANGRPRGCGGGKEREPTAEDVLTHLQRTDGRWARVGVWAVEEALRVLKEG